MTAPLRKATCSAALMPLRAASVVRTLARTEMFMPMKPVAPESSAPMAKPVAVCQERAKPMITSSTTPTRPMVRYWRLR